MRLLNLIHHEQAMELALRVEERNKVSGLRKTGLGGFKGSQYSPVSFRSPSAGGSTAYSLQLSPTSVRSWVSQTGESQTSISSPKPSNQSGTSKQGGEMRRLTDTRIVF